MQSERKEQYCFTELGFIGRERELGVFNEMLQKIQEGDLTGHKVLEIFGPPGIGKTRLLEKIKHQCEERNIAYLWLDVTHLINSQLNHSDITEVLDKNPRNQPAVLYIDQTEVLTAPDNRDPHDEMFELVRQLARNDRSNLVVWAGREYEMFHGDTTLGIKLRLGAWELAGITQEELENSGVIQAAAFRIIKHSAGYPPAIERVSRMLHEDFLSEDFELAQAAYEITHQTAFPEIPDQKVFEVLSLVDRFDVSTIRLAHFMHTGKIIKSSDAMDLICDWGTLVEWNTERGGYKVTDTIGGVIVNYLKYSPANSTP